MKKVQELYSGKAKTVYSTDDPRRLVLYFRDDTSAFNAAKLAKLKNKGMVNNAFNAFIMQTLEKAGIATHFIEQLSENESLVKALDMIRVECVVRNITAGNLCRRLGVPEGKTMEPPLFEFYLKSDSLGDPIINEAHILTFGWASENEIREMKQLSLEVNKVLQPLFARHGMLLVDYKLEFGRCDGKLVLGDEFTPDGCRIWDEKTHKILDKDRFRKDLGDVVESYQEAAKRLGITITTQP